MRIFLLFMFSISLIMCSLSCGESPSYQDDVIGAWRGAAWLVEGIPADRDAEQVHFLFNSDSTYAARYGGQSEEGVWYVKENKLYTLAEGQIQKMVVLNRVEPDTLVFDMNRTGTSEKLVLVRMN